jgi:hypothetical protein
MSLFLRRKSQRIRKKKNLKMKESCSGDRGKEKTMLYGGFFNEPGNVNLATAH